MTTKLNWLSELNPGGPVGRSGLQIAYFEYSSAVLTSIKFNKIFFVDK